MADNIDWEYLTANEGYKKKGYIPKDKNNKIIDSSGVTIGTGVDLGSKNAAYFASLPKTLRDKLNPYLGLKGTAAETALTNTPLSVTDAEARQINAVAKRAETDLIKEQWQSATGTSFDDLPQWMATPIASVLYQHGAGNPAKNIPKFWAAATAQDVQRMEAELRNFGDATPTRRKADADYLVGSLKDTTRQDLAKIIKKNAWQGTASEDYIADVDGITVDIPTPKQKPTPPQFPPTDIPTPKQKPTPPQFPPAASDLVDEGRIRIPELEGAADSYQLSDLVSDIGRLLGFK